MVLPMSSSVCSLPLEHGQHIKVHALKENDFSSPRSCQLLIAFSVWVDDVSVLVSMLGVCLDWVCPCLVYAVPTAGNSHSELPCGVRKALFPGSHLLLLAFTVFLPLFHNDPWIMGGGDAMDCLLGVANPQFLFSSSWPFVGLRINCHILMY